VTESKSIEISIARQILMHNFYAKC